MTAGTGLTRHPSDFGAYYLRCQLPTFFLLSPEGLSPDWRPLSAPSEFRFV